MKIKFKIAWRQYAKGDETEQIDAGIATTLVNRGIAETVEAKSIQSPPADKSMTRRTPIRNKHVPTAG